MLVTEELGEATFGRAAALVAREHAAARQARPELPGDFGDAGGPARPRCGTCAAAAITASS